MKLRRNPYIHIGRLRSGWTISRGIRKKTRPRCNDTLLPRYVPDPDTKFAIARRRVYHQRIVYSHAPSRDGHGTRGHVTVFVRFSWTMQQQRGRAKGVRRIPCTRGIHAENSGHVNLGKSYERLSLGPPRLALSRHRDGILALVSSLWFTPRSFIPYFWQGR